MKKSSKKHFELQDLIDYVRQTGPPERLEEMRRHIEGEGCEECGRGVTLLADAYGAARALARHEVPPEAVAKAQALFQPRSERRTAGWWRELPALAASLVAPPEPQPAGLRSAAVERERVFRSGSLQVRLLVDGDAGGPGAVVGVLTDVADARREYSDVTVLLTSGTTVLVQTRTSRYGEFHIELPDMPGLTLHFLLDGESQWLEVGIKN